MSDKPFRILPRLTDQNRHFWQGGEHGELRFLRCADCGTWIHPPSPRCPECLGKRLAPAAVSGRATLLTYTLNHQQWVPAPDHPYCIAIVEIEEQPGLRLMTNVVNCPAESVVCGMPVRVVFEQYEDVWMPLFEPDPGRSPSEKAAPQGRRPRGEPQASEVEPQGRRPRSEPQASEVGKVA